MTLDEIALKYGTDKASNWHNYTEIYERYFESKRNDIKNVLEIGVFRGSSVKMWAEYFPNAIIYGVDIDPECNQYDNDRIEIIIADATKPFPIAVPEFDVIIDDGSHKNIDIISSFGWLFKFVKSGGYYVVEDTNTSYWSEFNRDSPLHFFKRLIDYIHFNGVSGDNFRCERKYLIEKLINEDKEVPTLMKTIKSIHFYNGLIFIEKA